MTGCNNFKEYFKECTHLQYNGQLKIQSKTGNKWTFYYRLGRIVWASGGAHPYRRWRRYVKQYCSHISTKYLQSICPDISIEHWDYQVLEKLYEKEKIPRETINIIAENCITELLFDITQQAHFHSVSCDRSQDIILKTPISLTSTDISLSDMEQSWNKWLEAGLTNISPNQSPILRRPHQLKQEVSKVSFENFVKFMNGNYTLRDLAFIMKHNLTSVTRSLLPYILKGIIELVEVNDKPIQFHTFDQQCNTINFSSKIP